MATYTATLTITDKTAPEVTKVTMRVSDDGKTAVLYVTFSEDVDSTTALDKANYALIQGGKLTLLSKDPAFFDGNKVVKLELTESEYTELKKAGTGLFVQRVKDLAGNAMAGMTETSILAYNDSKNAPQVEKIEVLAADKAAIMFDQYLKRVDRNAISVNNTTVAAIELSEKDGKTVVTVITDKDAKFAPNITGSSVVIASSGDYKILNIFDVEAANANIDENTTITVDDKQQKVMVDKIAPSVDKDKSKAETGKNEIVLVYDEAIDFGTVSTLTFEVADRNVTSVEAGEENNEIKITVDGAAFVKDAKLKVTQKHVIKGADGNESKFDSIEITVKDAPEETGDPGQTGE
jgi:hypothetical protein